ncbi:glycine, alanine and asparagine-rich protein-like [Anopheles bellator]|uniref:glycine, alanine and asparagine-rich protein-like n=1 Tax=Anopheles bellator TaxID=139047 RepID=UPI00264903A1|nr:glycine, alanine and asparagine-rich protein-like [Anopheles bellator]
MTGSVSEDDPTHSGGQVVVGVGVGGPVCGTGSSAGGGGSGGMTGIGGLVGPGAGGGILAINLGGAGVGPGGSGSGGLGNLGGVLGTVSDVERTMKSLNGYHEDILEALRSAAQAQRSSANTPSGSISEELLRKTLAECVGGSQLNTTNVHPPEREYAAKRNVSSRTGSRENVCESQPHVLNDASQTATLLHHHRQQQQQHLAQQQQQAAGLLVDDEDTPSVGPLRIRNLEDLIRQLEHHSSRHMSPSGSEDIRMSETEAERHYRVDSSAACSESSHGSNQQLAQTQKTATILPPYSSRCRPPRSDDESRFAFGSGPGGGIASGSAGGIGGVGGGSGTGRYRHGAGRHPSHQSHSPHSFTHHSHHSHAHSSHAAHAGHSSHHSSHTHLHQDEEGIYESADPVHQVHPLHPHDPRTSALDQRDTNDSESDDLFQAQQQLARWASEDVVSVVVMEQGTDAAHSQGPSSANTTHGHMQQHPSQQQQPLHHHQPPQPAQPLVHLQQQPLPPPPPHQLIDSVNGVPVMGSCHNINNMNHQVNSRDYYPSPPSTETGSSGSVIQPLRRGPITPGPGPDGNHIMENTGRYPEYKH